MEPVGFFSGIVSGLDTRALVDQIIALERRPIERLQNQVNTRRTQIGALQTFGELVDRLKTSAARLRDGTALEAVRTTTTGVTSGNVPIVAASAAPGTSEGVFEVEVVSRAQTEKLGGQQYSSDTTALGLSGEFFINRSRIEIAATDTLLTVRDKINEANAGNAPTTVTASVLSSGPTVKRLILAAEKSGAAGIDVVDGDEGVLASLGLLDGTTSIKRATSDGAESDRFTARTTAVSTLLGLTSAPGATNVTVGGQSVSIDLTADSLDAIAAKIDGLTGISATVQSTVLASGATEYYLDINGTTSFADTSNVLQMLGVVKGGRAAVAHAVQGAVLTDGDAVTAASTGTVLTNLYSGGQDANVQVNDTLTISGTRGDGSAVSLSYTVGAGDTVQDVLDHLNNVTDGYGTGSRTATASIDAQGRLTVTDGTAGDSQLTLSIVANNEGGGTLDTGAFAVSQLGRQREIVAGADATLRVDGVTLTRSSNIVTDAVSGVTLTLLAAEAGTKATVTVERDVDAAEGSAEEFVAAYNEITGFVRDQLSVEVGAIERPALYGDSTLRLARSSLVNTLLAKVEGVAGDLATAGSAGISLQTDGTLKLDSTTFRNLFETRFNDLQRLFMERGTTTDAEVAFVTSASTAAPGTYAVEITQAATQATVQGSGFSGTYADDGTADVMKVTDTQTGFTAQINLVNGMTTAQIVDQLNTTFGLKEAQKLVSAKPLYSDPAATTAITAGTTFSSLYAADTTAANVTAGDTISYSAVRPDGTSFAGTYTVTDPTTDTVGDLVTRLQDGFGTDATVTVSGGSVVVEDAQSGLSLMTLSLTANNEGGGTLDFGAMDVAVTGRGVLSFTASAVGNDLKIIHQAYGSVVGFSVSYTPGGTDGTAQLGVGAAGYAGQDVAGTLGGLAATGAGQQLVGNAGTDVEGLHVRFTGSTARSAGNVSLTVGTGAQLERYLERLAEAGTGILDVKDDGLDDAIRSLEGRIDNMESRIEVRRTSLLRRFLDMEVTIARLQSQSAFIGSQINTLTGPLGGRGG